MNWIIVSGAGTRARAYMNWLLQNPINQFVMLIALAKKNLVFNFANVTLIKIFPPNKSPFFGYRQSMVNK